MNDILLTHYYHKDFQPFKSVSHNSDTTNEIVNKLSLLTGKAYGRFRNYEWYITQRKETEQWLYHRFLEIGGIPKLLNPIYFILGNSKYLQFCYGEDVEIYQIRLDEIFESDISFTLSDSMSIHVSGEERKVLTKKDLFAYVENQGETLIDHINNLDKKHKYIEAQVWDNCYFEK